MSDRVLPTILQDWVDAQNEHDASKHASLYTEDGVLEDVANGFRAEGAEAISAFLAKADVGFSDVSIEVRNLTGTDGTAAIEYDFSATNTGLIPIPGAKNKRFTSRAVTFFELRDGRIARSSDYYDSGAVIKQLGITAELLVGIGRALDPHGGARQ